MKRPDEAEPVRQLLKIVTVLDCVPGNAESADGKPITILTLGHHGEVEEPLMLSLADTERLVVDLLVALAAHGDKFASGLLDEHFTPDD